MSEKQQVNEIEQKLKRSAAQEWGWGLFGSAGIFCLLAFSAIYWWTVNFGVMVSRFWVAGIFCGIPLLVAYIGFLQGVSAALFVRLPRNWAELSALRRLVLIAFTAVAIYVAATAICFLVSLDDTPFVNVPF